MPFGRSGKANISANGYYKVNSQRLAPYRKQQHRNAVSGIGSSDSIREYIIQKFNDLNEEYFSKENNYENYELQRTYHIQSNDELIKEFIPYRMSTYNTFELSDIDKFNKLYKAFIEKKILEGKVNRDEYFNSHNNEARPVYAPIKYDFGRVDRYEYNTINTNNQNGGNKNKMSKKTKYNKTKTNNKNKKTKSRKRM